MVKISLSITIKANHVLQDVLIAERYPNIEWPTCFQTTVNKLRSPVPAERPTARVAAHAVRTIDIQQPIPHQGAFDDGSEMQRS